MKATSLVIFSLVSVIGGVIAQEKTLRVVNASFRASPMPRRAAATSDPVIDSAILDCMIEEDDISFKLGFGPSELERLLRDIQFVSLNF